MEKKENEAKSKAGYKSWKKKYRKMRITFDQKMHDTEELHRREVKAVTSVKRLAVENDRLLDLLLEVNDSPQIPRDRQINLSLPPIYASETAMLDIDRDYAIHNDEPTKKFEDLINEIPHLSYNVAVYKQSTLVADLNLSETDPHPANFLTADDVDNYIHIIDQSISPELRLPTMAPVAANPQLAHQALPGGGTNNAHLNNPTSVTNWLRKHAPKIFLQDGESHATNGDGDDGGAGGGGGEGASGGAGGAGSGGGGTGAGGASASRKSRGGAKAERGGRASLRGKRASTAGSRLAISEKERERERDRDNKATVDVDMSMDDDVDATTTASAVNNSKENNGTSTPTVKGKRKRDDDGGYRPKGGSSSASRPSKKKRKSEATAADGGGTAASTPTAVRKSKKDKDKTKERSKDKDKEKSKEKDKDKEKSKEKEREKSKEKEREKSKEKEKEKEKDRDSERDAGAAD